MYDYPALKKKLTTIIDDQRTALTTGEREEVRTFIEAGEFGIALETLCSILHEKAPGVPPSTISLIEDVGVQMGMEPAVWTELKPPDETRDQEG